MIASDLAEEMFFLQMEENATFITSTLEVITQLGTEVLHPPSYHRAGQDGRGPAQQAGYHGPVQPQPGHCDVGPRSEQQSTWPVTLHYSRPSSHEGARVMVACWMEPR